MKISIITPVYNVSSGPPYAYEQSLSVLRQGLSEAEIEIIFIDDGGRDESFLHLVAIARADRTVKVIRFAGNRGAHMALRAGLRYATRDFAAYLFEMDRLTKFRTTWKDGLSSGAKKLKRVRAFFGFAHEREWILNNPAAKLKPPIGASRPAYKHPFSDDELKPSSRRAPGVVVPYWRYGLAPPAGSLQRGLAISIAGAYLLMNAGWTAFEVRRNPMHHEYAEGAVRDHEGRQDLIMGPPQMGFSFGFYNNLTADSTPGYFSGTGGLFSNEHGLIGVFANCAATAPYLGRPHYYFARIAALVCNNRLYHVYEYTKGTRE